MPTVDNIPNSTVKVNGVLINNTEIRNSLLSMNRGKYHMYDEVLSPAIGEYYEMRDFKSPRPITGDKSLSEYTYDRSGDYGKSIIERYRISDWLKSQYGVTENRKINLYDNGSNSYLNYVDTVYGDNAAWLKSIDNILSITNIDRALRRDETGVVRNPRVLEAMAGVVTTNPNYRDSSSVVNIAEAIYQGSLDPIKDLALVNTDTALGLITNKLYSQSLFNGAKFNSARGRDGSGAYTYITPRLFNIYGNNLKNVTKLSDLFSIDQNTGRNRDDFSGRVMELHEVNNENNGYSQHITDQFYEALRLLDNEFGSDLMTYRYNPLVGGNSDSDSGYLDGYDTEMGLSLGNVGNGNVKRYDDNGGYAVNGEDETYSVDTRISQHHIYDETGVVYKGGDVGTEFDNYYSMDYLSDITSNSSLLKKTQKMFTDGTINTMISRFVDSKSRRTSTIDTAITVEGKSHGRALLKGRNNLSDYTTYINGVWNPFCRTWTYHHQYDRYSKAIRPFGGKSIEDLQGIVEKSGLRPVFNDDVNLSGSKYLAENTVLDNNGLVRITPYRDQKKRKAGDNVEKPRYMFSIENLAWKDYYGYVEQNRKGPNGGRIMWFPPYDLDFQENVSVEWNANSFIGRGEKVYTYTNTDRTAQLNFTILIDHPSTIDTIGESYQGKNGDPDGDILRYFAGCDVLEPDGQASLDGSSGTTNEGSTENDNIVGPGNDTITFYVFFPNNYSGHMNSSTAIDDDWAEYIMFGKNVKFDMNDMGRGYEMSLEGNHGVTDESSLSTKYMDGTPSCSGGTTCANCIPIEDEKRIFMYRVDCDRRDEVFANANNYLDCTSSMLNSSSTGLGKTSLDTPSNCFSFAQVYAALMKIRWQTDEYEAAKNRIPYDQREVVDKLAELLEQEDRINEIKVTGGASAQNSPRAVELADRRCVSTMEWLELAFENCYNKIKSGGIFRIDEKWSKEKDNKTPDIRAQKCAKVEITFDVSSVVNNGNPNDTVSGSTVQVEETADDNIVTSNTVVGDADISEYEYFKRIETDDPFVFRTIKQKYQYFDPAFHSMSPEGFNARLNFLHQCTRQGHTISASEVSGNNSVKMAPTAGNLSFGRMPVCVLRIGDFINTRMIIQSMSITYSNDGISWDLNPEGIGVQPMFAKVSMGVVLIGGSALNMPVNRLQNANTFNYYANTGVYDGRADRVRYIGNSYDNGVEYTNIYTPGDNTDKNEDNGTDN